MSAKATQTFLSSIGFEGDRLMVWPACSPDFHSVENFWGILKPVIYHDGKPYSSKDDLWKEIKTAAINIMPSEIRKLTESVDKRIEIIFQNKGPYVKY